MARNRFDVQSDDLRKLAADLKDLSPQTLKAFRKQVRAAARKPVRELRAEIQALPHVPSEWRDAMAKSVTVEVPTSKKSARVSIAMKGAKMPGTVRRTSKSINSKGFWRHPVYGNTEVWARQESTQGYFWNSFTDDYGPVQQAALQAMDDAARAAKLR